MDIIDERCATPIPYLVHKFFCERRTQASALWDEFLLRVLLTSAECAKESMFFFALALNRIRLAVQEWTDQICGKEW